MSAEGTEPGVRWIIHSLRNTHLGETDQLYRVSWMHKRLPNCLCGLKRLIPAVEGAFRNRVAAGVDLRGLQRCVLLGCVRCYRCDCLLLSCVSSLLLFSPYV